MTDVTAAQAILLTEYNLPNPDQHKAALFLSTRFPAAYVAALDKLVHPDCYVACFAKTPEIHSMWST